MKQQNQEMLGFHQLSLIRNPETSESEHDETELSGTQERN